MFLHNICDDIINEWLNEDILMDSNIPTVEELSDKENIDFDSTSINIFLLDTISENGNPYAVVLYYTVD